MANPIPQNIDSLLESISNLSKNASLRSVARESGSLNEPRHQFSSTHTSIPTSIPTSIDALIAKMQVLSLSTKLTLASRILNHQLGMLSHVSAEIRIPIYDLVARNATYALNEPKALSRLTNGQSDPPGLMKASPQYGSEFTERLRRTAWPTILIGQELETTGATDTTTRVLELVDDFCLQNGHLTKLAIVAHKSGGPFLEIANTTSFLVNLLSPETISVPNNNHSDLTKLRVIIYVKYWDTISELQQPNNGVDWAVENLWIDNHAAFAPHTPRATRFPALQEMEVEIRYESLWGAEDYTYRYTKAPGQAPDCDTIIIPTSTGYREDLEEMRDQVLLSPAAVIPVLRRYLQIVGLKWILICLWKVMSWDGSIALGTCFWGLFWIWVAEMVVLLKWGWLAIVFRMIQIRMHRVDDTRAWWALFGSVVIWVLCMHFSVPIQVW